MSRREPRPGRCTTPVRRAWLWTSLALALAAVAALLWSGSDARATSNLTSPLPAPPTGTPAADLSAAWSASGDPLSQPVVQDGRVLVGSAHGVAGLDPRSGREVWHYRRANAWLCGLTAADGVAVAVFRRADRCDEAVALTASTGVRAWNRMVDFHGEARLSSGERTVLAVSENTVADLDPTGDNVRWSSDAPAECRVTAARSGSAGVAVLQVCPSLPVQVRLLDGATGTQRWAVPVPDDAAPQLAGAEGLVTVVVRDRLQAYAAADGALLQSIPLPPGAGDAGQVAVGDLLVVAAHGSLAALDRATGALRWQRPAQGAPAVVARPGGQALLVPEPGAFVLRDPASGAELGRSSAAGLEPGGTVDAVGPVVVHRLPGRVVGYR